MEPKHAELTARLVDGRLSVEELVRLQARLVEIALEMAGLPTVEDCDFRTDPAHLVEVM